MIGIGANVRWLEAISSISVFNSQASNVQAGDTYVVLSNSVSRVPFLCLQDLAAREERACARSRRGTDRFAGGRRAVRRRLFHVVLLRDRRDDERTASLRLAAIWLHGR